jgi:hypothetical protein
MTSREFASWPDPLAECRQNARTLQGKYQDTAKSLDQADRALTRIAERHANDGRGRCSYCWDEIPDAPMKFPCPDYLDATGAAS